MLNRALRLAAKGLVVLVAVEAVSLTAKAVSKAIEHAQDKKRVKEGSKDGSVIELDGRYYEVVEND